MNSAKFLGDETLFKFLKNVIDAEQNKEISLNDFIARNSKTGKFIWYVSVINRTPETIHHDSFEIVDFNGGFYAVATAIDP